MGMTDLLLETQLDEEQRDYVSTARLCAENLFHLLNATLGLFRAHRWSLETR